jgi:hypothetical protein
VDSSHGVVDRGATGPSWSSGHCRVRELTEARPPAAPVPESSGQEAGKGKEWPGELNGGVTVGQEAVEGRLTGGVNFGNGGGAQERGK